MAACDYGLGSLGGGAAGLPTAAGTAQSGKKTILVGEVNRPGGDCLHFGCIPSTIDRSIGGPFIYKDLGTDRKDFLRAETDGRVEDEPSPDEFTGGGGKMKKLMTVMMGRGEFLRVALLLAGGTLLDFSFPRGRVHSAGITQARKGGNAMEKERIKIYSVARGGYVTEEKVIKTEKEWRSQLTPEQFAITRKKGTERAFTGKYDKHYEKGVYRCVCCGTDLFRSETKYDSRTGWPSFYAPIARENIRTESDWSWFIRRTEVLCARCDAHLGHVFKDGPKPTGLRYCMNSVALTFAKAEGGGK
jgi:peptide-methionine (R)-S-oxide reductase